jgi:excisionase family DNA binding protein
MLSTGEAAHQLGIGDHVLARLARQGAIALQRCGRNFIVSEDQLGELRRALEEHGVMHYDRRSGEHDA